jgi:hypothetical protein
MTLISLKIIPLQSIAPTSDFRFPEKIMPGQKLYDINCSVATRS